LGISSDDLDNWRCRVHWFFRYSGFDGSNDPVASMVHFRNETNSLIGTVKGPYVTLNQTWGDNPIIAPIPPQTRKIEFGWHAQRSSGSNNDGYVDNCSAYISRPYSSTFVFSGISAFLNGGAEVGSLSPWVNIVNSVWVVNSTATNVMSGNYAFSCGSGANGTMIQVIDINSIAVNTVSLANSDMQLIMNYWWRIPAVEDQGRIFIRLLDAASNEIAVSSVAEMRWGPRKAAIDSNSMYAMATQFITLTNTTRLIELRATVTRLSGSNCDFYFDNASLWTVTGSQDLVIASSGPTAMRAFPSGILSGRDFPTTRLREFPHD
jgi:hypothetical protein